MAVELRPEEKRRPLQHLVGPPQLPVLLLELTHPLRLRAAHAGSDTVIDVGLLHPHPHGLNTVTELRRDALDRPLRDTELRTQRPHHPHRGGLLLDRVPTRRRLPIRQFLRHNSILVSKVGSLQQTQGASTVGKGAGLAPGTRSGLWSCMATTIEALQPHLVVIENVRGLLSAPATRPQRQGATDGRNLDDATPALATLRDLELGSGLLGDEPARPLRALGAVLGDLADLRYDAQWIGLPASLAGAPHHRFRIFITAHRQDTVPHSAGLGLLPRRRDPGQGPGSTGHHRPLSPDHRLRPPRTGWITDQQVRLGDTVRPDCEHVRRWGRYADAIARWEHITGRDAPSPAILNEHAGPRPAPGFVEWLMGLPPGWVTNPAHALTAYQQTTALGNGVLPLQASLALRSML